MVSHYKRLGGGPPARTSKGMHRLLEILPHEKLENIQVFMFHNAAL